MMSSSESQNETNNTKKFPINSTKQFKKIMLKYNKSTKSKNYHQKKILFQNMLEKIEQVGKNEKVKDYFENEVHRNIAIKTEIINTFGVRVVYHINEMGNYKPKIKAKKAKFFNPLELYLSNKPKNFRNNSYDNISKNLKCFNYKNHKYINFPQILNENQIIKDIKNIKNNKLKIKKEPEKSSFLIKVNEYSFDNQNISEIERNKNNENDNNNNRFLCNGNKRTTPNKKNNKIMNNNNSSNVSIYSSSKGSSFDKFPLLTNTPIKTERNSAYFQKKKLQNNIKKNKNLINLEYMNYIKDINEKSVLEEEKKKKFFDNYKYGCDQFKIKYRFLKEKYFV